MEKNEVIEALKRIKEISNKRNFNQSIDLIINLKGLDLKKQEQQLDLFSTLHFDRGKKVSVCGLMGPELQTQAKELFDEVILADDFVKFKDKKEIKKLANKHDFFVAQATIMPKVAATFGRVLGPRGKMPNPKIGCVVAPNANLKPLHDKLQKTIRLMTKSNPIIQCSVGKEDTNENEVADNILTIYSSVLHALPNEKQNVKNVYLKLTMGKAVKVGEKIEKEEEEKKNKKPKRKIAQEKPKEPEEKKDAEKIAKKVNENKEKRASNNKNKKSKQAVE